MPIPSVIKEYIDITPGVLGGKPPIAGHRISVTHVAEIYLKNGNIHSRNSR